MAASRPYWAAHMRAVRPFLSVALISGSFVQERPDDLNSPPNRSRHQGGHAGLLILGIDVGPVRQQLVQDAGKTLGRGPD